MNTEGKPRLCREVRKKVESQEFPSWLSGNKLASIHEDAGLIPALLSGFRIWHCCELQYKPATAAPIRPLAWEPPYATGVSLKRKKKKKVESQTSFLKCGVKF